MAVYSCSAHDRVMIIGTGISLWRYSAQSQVDSQPTPRGVSFINQVVAARLVGAEGRQLLQPCHSRLCSGLTSVLTRPKNKNFRLKA